MKDGKRKLKDIPDQEIQDIYNEIYIGQSRGLSECAWKLGTNDNSLRKRILALGLPLRGRAEAGQARKQIGQPWVWPGEETAETPLPKPDPDPPQETPVQQKPIKQPEPVEKPTPTEDDPGPGRRAIVVHAADYTPTLPDRPQWLPPSSRSDTDGYQNHALADLSRLVKDLTNAGANVEINLNIDLEINP